MEYYIEIIDLKNAKLELWDLAKHLLDEMQKITFSQYILLIKNKTFLEYLSEYKVEPHPFWKQQLSNIYYMIKSEETHRKGEAIINLLIILNEQKVDEKKRNDINEKHDRKDEM